MTAGAGKIVLYEVNRRTTARGSGSDSRRRLLAAWANLPGPYNNKVKRDEIEREARENEGSGKRGIMEKE